MAEFTAEEFADYWETVSNDTELGIDFMARNVVTDEGKTLLGNTCTVMAKRHGVSSPQIKTFRSALRKACVKAGIEDILTPKKVKGTGTTTFPAPMMVLEVSKPQKVPTDTVTLLYNRMKKWITKDGFSKQDVVDAVNRINADL